MSDSTAINSSASAASAGSASGKHRRSRMLAKLDIDVWQFRTQRTEAAEAASTERVAEPVTGGGPAAARLLLEASIAGAGSGTGRGTGASSPRPATPPVAADAPSTITANPLTAAPVTAAPLTAAALPNLVAEPPLDLWCLSGAHGVLLANFVGLAPADQRLLNDVFQATMRLVGAGTDTLIEVPDKPAKVKFQQLRFSWPPAPQGGQSVPADAAAPVSRALRGFLNRQLQGKTNPVILLAAAELQERLADIELPASKDRLIYIGLPGQLVGDGAAKRTLWETLSSL